ncbi:hypothetical protein A2165_02135 [Candidatus Curtissbacteria bacterium RBG_13_40_7]|uniref:Uncharacterized protein n=1 Tax=Candidatus Curtissbacteria bacterium RBG_13_40_7 TaxID=1797706 RepID=A0A1F5FYV7_9BACT|nr:MAG: hypothetical protein A2165_02135 [Candidatus Curtissbacteria bacterium RBG_13_40_7]
MIQEADQNSSPETANLELIADLMSREADNYDVFVVVRLMDRPGLYFLYDRTQYIRDIELSNEEGMRDSLRFFWESHGMLPRPTHTFLIDIKSTDAFLKVAEKAIIEGKVEGGVRNTKYLLARLQSLTTAHPTE